MSAYLLERVERERAYHDTPSGRNSTNVTLGFNNRVHRLRTKLNELERRFPRLFAWCSVGLAASVLAAVSTCGT